MKKLFLLLFSLCGACLAVTYQPAASGDWSNAATWTPAGVPGFGDTISCPNSATAYTVTLSDTRIIGQALTAGNVAINFGINCALVISPGGYLECRGDMTYAGSPDDGGTYYTLPYLTIQGGGIFEWDSSSAPSTQYSSYPDNLLGARPLITQGTPANHAVIRSNPNGGHGYFGLGGHGQIGGAYFLTYTDVSRIGDATHPAFVVGNKADNASNYFPWDATHNKFTSCGLAPYSVLSMASTDVWRHSFNVHVGSLGPSVLERSGSADDSRDLTTGIREIHGNVFDIRMSNFWDSNGFDTQSNYFGEGWTTAVSVEKPGKVWRSYVNNFFRTSISAGALLNSVVGGNAENDYWLLDEANSFNPHGPAGGPSANQVLTGQIMDHTGKIEYQSSVFFATPNHDPGSTNSHELRNSILLPNAEGLGSFWISSVITTTAGSLQTMAINHNTVIASANNNNIALTTAHATTQPGFTGQLASYKDNILWAPKGSQPGYKLYALTPNINPPDICLPASCDYNNGWNMLTDGAGYSGGGRGYAALFSSTPGVHDLAVDPMFVDPTRNVATFDSAYLGNHPPAWSSASTYSVGDMVSSSDPTLYANATINYRYIDGPGCGETNPKPGLMGGTVAVTNGSNVVTWVSGPKFSATWPNAFTGIDFPIGDDSTSYTSCSGSTVCKIAGVSNCTGGLCTTLTLTTNYNGPTGNQPYATLSQPLQSRACWEWASLYRIRQGVANQSLYEDTSIGVYGNDIITTLMRWDRGGFSPTNPALALAASDGTDIGAVPVTFPAPTYPSTTGGTGIGSALTLSQIISYEVGSEASGALPISSLGMSRHSITINDGAAKTLAEASCVTDSGSQAVTVTAAGSPLFTITCVPESSYSRAVTDGSAGYITAPSMNSVIIAPGAILDLNGAPNTTTKDLKLFAYGN